jgi:4-hydroxy-tetrahydrodipicolinate synthase
MDAAVEGAAGRTPVVAGIGHDTRTAACLARHAADAGVSLIVANPLYYVTPSYGGYSDHILTIASESGLPVIIYSSPSYPATEELIENLVDVEGFAGVKEEYFDVPSTAQRIRRWGDRLLWWGVGEQVGCDFAAVGATTVTTSLANVDPTAAVDYIKARLDGTTPDAGLIDLVSTWENEMTAGREGVPSFLKEAMHQHAGWLRNVRSPLRPADTDTHEKVEKLLFVSRRRQMKVGQVSA